MHRVATSGYVRLVALSKATDFTRGRCKPEFAVLAQFELGILHGGAGAGINNGAGGPKGMGRQGGRGDGFWCSVWMRQWGCGKHGTGVIDSVRGNCGAVAFFRLAWIRYGASGWTRSCGFILLVFCGCLLGGGALGCVLLAAPLAGIAGANLVSFSGRFGQCVNGQGWRCRGMGLSWYPWK